MVAFHCAATSLPPSTAGSPSHRKPFILLSSISPTFPSQITARRNYLRHKLLKTLTKPYPNHLLPESPPARPVIPAETPRDKAPAAEETNQSETPELQTSEISSGAVKSVFGKFSTRSVLKIGLYLVGAYLFQAIVTVWIFGLSDDDDIGRDAKTPGFNGNGENYLNKINYPWCESQKGNTVAERKRRTRASSTVLGLNTYVQQAYSLSNGKAKSSSRIFSGQLGVKSDENAVVGVSDLGEKINQIQEMARDARRREILDSKKNSSESTNGVIVKPGIKKEVDRKLVKVRTNLNKSSEKSPLFPVVNYLGKDKKVVETNDTSDPLKFKKKYKFRTPLGNVSDKPKGFQGSKDGTSKSRNGGSDIERELRRDGSSDNSSGDYLDDVQHLNQTIGSSKKPSKGKFKSFQSSRTKLGKERGKTARAEAYGVARLGPDTGATQESGPEITTVVNGSGAVQGAIDSKEEAARLRSKKLDDEPKFWWSSLPYVLAILMRRGDDEEGPNGLFTVKTSMDKDGSYTVAFEDRGDATNFCYLLESFFEDLGDFGADIVPLTNKEVEEAVRSGSMKKMVVVKKGQLKLYAGQPLPEVEVALRSIIESSSS